MAQVVGNFSTRFWHSPFERPVFGIDLGQTLCRVIRGGRIQPFNLILKTARFGQRDGSVNAGIGCAGVARFDFS